MAAMGSICVEWLVVHVQYDCTNCKAVEVGGNVGGADMTVSTTSQYQLDNVNKLNCMINTRVCRFQFALYQNFYII
jgi:hypothetical protein